MGFKVITNGCDITPRQASRDIRATLGFKESDFVFVSVGNIGMRKNQIQTVEAMSMLVAQGILDIKCIFCGSDIGGVNSLQSAIYKFNVQGYCICSGFVDKEELTNYYQAADATILTSLSEGFGLSIIEGFVYGKPCLTFADLPAVKDLYCESAMMLCPVRETYELAECMIQMKSQSWSSDIIKRHASNFSFEKMSENYIGFYKEIIHDK